MEKTYELLQKKIEIALRQVGDVDKKQKQSQGIPTNVSQTATAAGRIIKSHGATGVDTKRPSIKDPEWAEQINAAINRISKNKGDSSASRLLKGDVNAIGPGKTHEHNPESPSPHSVHDQHAHTDGCCISHASGSTSIDPNQGLIKKYAEWVEKEVNLAINKLSKDDANALLKRLSKGGVNPIRMFEACAEMETANSFFSDPEKIKIRTTIRRRNKYVGSITYEKKKSQKSTMDRSTFINNMKEITANISDLDALFKSLTPIKNSLQIILGYLECLDSPETNFRPSALLGPIALKVNHHICEIGESASKNYYNYGQHISLAIEKSNDHFQDFSSFSEGLNEYSRKHMHDMDLLLEITQMMLNFETKFDLDTIATFKHHISNMEREIGTAAFYLVLEKHDHLQRLTEHAVQTKQHNELTDLISNQFHKLTVHRTILGILEELPITGVGKPGVAFLDLYEEQLISWRGDIDWLLKSIRSTSGDSPFKAEIISALSDISKYSLKIDLFIKGERTAALARLRNKMPSRDSNEYSTLMKKCKIEFDKKQEYYWIETFKPLVETPTPRFEELENLDAVASTSADAAKKKKKRTKGKAALQSSAADSKGEISVSPQPAANDDSSALLSDPKGALVDGSAPSSAAHPTLQSPSKIATVAIAAGSRITLSWSELQEVIDGCKQEVEQRLNAGVAGGSVNSIRDVMKIALGNLDDLIKELQSSHDTKNLKKTEKIALLENIDKLKKMRLDVMDFQHEKICQQKLNFFVHLPLFHSVQKPLWEDPNCKVYLENPEVRRKPLTTIYPDGAPWIETWRFEVPVRPEVIARVRGDGKVEGVDIRGDAWGLQIHPHFKNKDDSQPVFIKEKFNNEQTYIVDQGQIKDIMDWLKKSEVRKDTRENSGLTFRKPSSRRLQAS